MEALGILEKKLASLLELAKSLKEENEKLKEKNLKLSEENSKIRQEIETLESSSLNKTEELNQEKEMTRMIVDGLIKDINGLIENESI